MKNLDLLDKVKTELEKKGYNFEDEKWDGSLHSILYDAVFSTEKVLKNYFKSDRKLKENKLVRIEKLLNAIAFKIAILGDLKLEVDIKKQYLIDEDIDNIARITIINERLIRYYNRRDLLIKIKNTL